MDFVVLSNGDGDLRRKRTVNGRECFQWPVVSVQEELRRSDKDLNPRAEKFAGSSSLLVISCSIFGGRRNWFGGTTGTEDRRSSARATSAFLPARAYALPRAKRTSGTSDKERFSRR